MKAQAEARQGYPVGSSALPSTSAARQAEAGQGYDHPAGLFCILVIAHGDEVSSGYTIQAGALAMVAFCCWQQLRIHFKQCNHKSLLRSIVTENLTKGTFDVFVCSKQNKTPVFVS